MGIELPPELADVAAKTGVAWPEADEEALARSAQAWRDAATSTSTLATDADTTARSALSTVAGAGADKASAEWKTFVEPDSGHLTAAVRGCNDAADRLENAATQVGAAKVEIVRNLVGLAQNTDAANAAASAGHPFALAGLDTAVRGTAANVAHIETQLVSAVQPGAGIDMATVQNPVNPNPGTHLQAGITTGVADLVTTTTDAVASTTHDATTLVGDTAQQAGLPGAGTHGGPAADTLHRATNLVGDATNLVGDTAQQGGNLAGNAAHGATDLVSNVGHGAADLVGNPGHGATDLVGNPGHGATDLVGNTAHGATDVVGNVGHGAADVVGDPVGPGHPGPGGLLPGDIPPGRPDDILPGHQPGDPDITGPVPIDNLPDDAPTPPAGQTMQAGFAGGLEPAAAPANLPPAAVAPPLNPAAPAYGGQPGFGGAPGFGAAPVAPIAPGVPGAPAGPAPAGPAPGAVPAARPAVSPTFLPAAASPAAAQGDRPAAAEQPARKPMAGPPGAPPPSSRGERDQVLAAFWIHMFPIGHLPVASNKPARQLPPPPEEMDYAAGLRFEPADHPEFHLIDGTPRLTDLHKAITEHAAAKAAKAVADAAPVPLPPSTPPPVPPVAAYDPNAARQPWSPPPGQQPWSQQAPIQQLPIQQAGQQPAAGQAWADQPAAQQPWGQQGSAQPSSGQQAAVQPGQQVLAQPSSGQQAAAAQAWIEQPAAQPAQPQSGQQAPAQPGQQAQASNEQPPAQWGEPAPTPTITIRQSAGMTADHPTVQALLEDHDPLGDTHERDWDRRYLVRLGSVTAQGISPEGLEYNWPTSEQYPEGGSAHGEAETLPKDTVIDRFGSPEGRVFAQDGTPFAQRSLPPAHKDAGYRRYRILKPLPVWRAVSAAWFGQPGGGIRYRTTHSAAELVALGYFEETA